MNYSIAAVVVLGAMGLGACTGPAGPQGVQGVTGQTGRTSMDRVIVTPAHETTVTTETVVPAPVRQRRTTTYSN